jgi:hypothetical protein
MEDKIPVEFEYHGKHYKGYLEKDHSSAKSWCLKVPEYRKGRWGTYHWGVLIIYNGDIWRMTNHKDDMLHLSDYFRDVVLNWYQ